MIISSSLQGRIPEWDLRPEPVLVGRVVDQTCDWFSGAPWHKGQNGPGIGFFAYFSQSSNKETPGNPAHPLSSSARCDNK
jgi:hypothetical protein